MRARHPYPLPRRRYRVTVKWWTGQRFNYASVDITTTGEASARLAALPMLAESHGRHFTPQDIATVEVIG